MAVYSCPCSPYQDGYEEGRRTALHLVVRVEESAVYAAAKQAISEDWRPYTFRAYWLGMLRGLRLHFEDAYMPNVLEARRRRGIC